VAVTPDGKRAVSGSYDKTLKVWDLESSCVLASFHYDAPASCCAFMDKRRVIAGDLGGHLHVIACGARCHGGLMKTAELRTGSAPAVNASQAGEQ
jgi:WD40 repeat protein